jgi:succinoglycan biosynthesis transport protein ExoP
MLQTTKDQPPSVERRAEITPAEESFKLFVSFIRRQFPVIASVTLLGIAVGVIYLITTPPSYTARAMLLVDSRKVNLFQQQSILGEIPLDTASVESQIEVLKSDNVALSVIKDFHLAQDPEFIASSDGLFGTVVGFIFNPFGSSEPTSEFQHMRSALRAFQSRLNIKRVELSYVMEISFRSFHPERAAQIANAVAEAYIVDQLGAKYQATKRASDWLQERIQELRDQASAAERAVVEFKTKNNIVTTGGTNGGRLMGEQQVAELNSQLVIVRAQTAEARARLDRIETVLRADSPDATVNSTVTDTLKNEVITKLRTQYLDLANRQADWSARYGADHLAAIHLRNQMDEIRKSILNELQRIAESYKSDYQIARQREEGIQNELSNAISRSQATDQAQVTVHELESISQTYRSLYDNFLHRYMESVQQQSFPISEARLISPALRPLQKSNPKTLIVLAISGLGAMIFGLGFGMLRDRSDRVFRTGDQVTNVLQTHCIALVPLIDIPKPKLAHTEFRSILGNVKTITAEILGYQQRTPVDPRSIPRRKGLLYWTVVDAPFSRFAEAIRYIKLAVDLNGVAKSHKVIGFTSSLPDEGKSTLAIALAQLMSQGSRRVILVDCDLRNPTLSRQLAPEADAGLLEIIDGSKALDDVVWKDRVTNMVLLPAVARSRTPHTSEILASDALKNLFDKLRQSYDYVIVDFSPLAPIIDVRATTHLVDSYVFVIEWGRTKIDVAQHALGSAQILYENLVGIVLNKVNMNRLRRYVGHHQSYYYNKNYTRYGYTE